MNRFFRPGPLFATFALMSALCSLLVELRMRQTGHGYYGFLHWNLTLAWVPFAIALVARFRQCGGVELAATSGLWLLFFPNAPYLFSDFVHLGHSAVMPLWLDGLMLFSYGLTGALLGFASLLLMQQLWRRAWGSAGAWVAVLTTLTLTSVGIYLGRVFRLNSWDALLRPRLVLRILGEAMSHSLAHAWVLVGLILVSALLIVVYSLLYAALHRSEVKSYGK